MHLKRLEILGFKSFGDKTVIHFKPGITAIVGPNGCGKSNTADALLWALGEQSSKTLRGERMEDVLFNGSEGRKPLGLAEVSLTFSDVQGEIETNAFTTYREITIARRLYRSGESEYIINKIPCRLKDIRELLIDSGAGAKGHTIIEQGKVDHILNASPLERREIVEETAGIAKYKLRKTETLRKLEATKLNIDRVRDIISEVQRQMNSLDRQAKKAERYNALKAEIQALETRLAAHQYRTQGASLAQMGADRDRAAASETAALADMATLEATTEQMKLSLVSEEETFSRLQSDLAEKDAGIQKGEYRVEVLQHQIREWEAQVKRAEEEIGRLGRDIEDGFQTLSKVEGEADSVERSLAEMESRLGEEEGRLKEIDRGIVTLEETIEAEKSGLFAVTAQAAESRNDATAVAFRKSELDRLAAKAADEERHVTGQLDAVETNLASVREVLTRADANREEKRRESATLREQIAVKSKTFIDFEEHLTTERASFQALQARLQSLQEIRTSLAGYQDGVRAVMRGEGDFPVAPVRGILADVLDVSSDYERAIEAALGDRLQTIVCENTSDIRAAIEYLCRHGSGRATFISAEVAGYSAAVPNPPPRGWVGRAIDLVSIRPEYEAAVRALLGQTAVVSDLETAMTLPKWSSDFSSAVTLAGEVAERIGTVSGGSENRHRGLLQTRREIKSLESAVLETQNRLASKESKREYLRESLAGSEALLEGVEADCHRIEVEQAARAAELDALDQERSRLVGRLEFLRLENEQRLDEKGALDESAVSLEERGATLEALRTAKEASLVKLQERLKLLRQERNSASERVTETKVACTSRRERFEGLVEHRRQIRLTQQSREGKLEEERKLLRDLGLKIGSAAAEMETCRREIESAIERKRILQATMVEQADTCARLKEAIREREEHYRLRRRESDDLGRKRQELDLRVSEIRLNLEHLMQMVRDAYREEVSDLAEKFKDVEIEPDAAAEALSGLKSAIEQMGPVNLTAIEEFSELEQRHAFLSRQEADLTEAIDSLHKAIAKINHTTRKMFMETFALLREKFSEVFARFFEGGRAELILLDEHNPLESGVEIAAQPPGKKLRNISLLSGGERALTAISLLFASFLIHPTPFCLLDEIDAPLDDENIRRFTQVLKKMSETSQFLIITHNKRTMEIADVLYGVTMEERGISKIVSVNLHSDHGGRSARTEAAMMAEA